jgi:hypothetical protein
MATEKVVLRDTKKAGENFFGGAIEPQPKQFSLVKITETDTLVLAASTDRAFVLLDTPEENQYGTYAMLGIVKVKCGEEIKEGQLVSVFKSGEGKAGVAATGQFIVGIALEKGKTGALISVFATTSGAKA